MAVLRTNFFLFIFLMLSLCGCTSAEAMVSTSDDLYFRLADLSDSYDGVVLLISGKVQIFNPLDSEIGVEHWSSIPRFEMTIQPSLDNETIEIVQFVTEGTHTTIITTYSPGTTSQSVSARVQFENNNQSQIPRGLYTLGLNWRAGDLPLNHVVGATYVVNETFQDFVYDPVPDFWGSYSPDVTKTIGVYSGSLILLVGLVSILVKRKKD